jgi:hypothetical protein
MCVSCNNQESKLQLSQHRKLHYKIQRDSASELRFALGLGKFRVSAKFQNFKGGGLNAEPKLS